MKGVNDNGELVGEYLTTELHGFYNYGTTFLNPEPANLRFSGVWSIYNHGTIVVAGTHNSTRHYNGYHSDSPFSSFNPVDVAGSAFTDLFDINDAGIMVGGYSVSGSYTAFVYDRALGTFSAVSMPGAAQTTAIGINNSNHVAGSYTDGSGARHASCSTAPATRASTYPAPR